MDLTKFYFPGSRSSLRMANEESDCSSFDEDNSSAEEEKICNDPLIGFVGSNTNDARYETILEHIQVDIELEDAIYTQQRWTGGEIEKAILEKSSPMLKVRRESIPDEVKTEIVMNCLYKNKTQEEESQRTGLHLQAICNVIYEFKSILNATKKDRKSLSMKRTKIKERHLKCMQKFVEDNLSKGFTLQKARHHLLEEYPGLKRVTLSTLSRLFKHKLSLSYKKLGITNPNKMKPDKKEQLISCLKAIIGCLGSEFYTIFLDEFLVNRNTTNSYGWAYKGKSGRLLRRPNEFKMSFVVAHSPQRVEGILGTKTTFNQVKYIKFLKLLLQQVKREQCPKHTKVVLVADNCKFHRTEKVRQFLMREEVVCMFIPPYCPEINSCEKLINYIKTYIKKCISDERVVSLKTIERAIDSVTKVHCNGFISASLQETLHLLKKRVV